MLLRPDLWNDLQRKVFSKPIERASAGVISEYLHTHTERKLQIGAGDNNKTGWLNTEIEPKLGQAYLDASRPFPLPDRSFKYVFSEHVIEHLRYESAMVMLKESYRILEVGGRARVITPNLNKLLELFQTAKSPATEEYSWRKLNWHGWPHTPDTAAYILNSEMHEFGHQFLYTPQLMKANLEAAGFQIVKQVQVGESDDPALQHIDARGQWGDVKDASNYESMVFEAVRVR
jgi:predicted SAM-dependent methyltransferase